MINDDRLNRISYLLRGYISLVADARTKYKVQVFLKTVKEEFAFYLVFKCSAY